MGMAASQGRLLCMTARLSNNEFEQQSVAYSKQKLADDSMDANDRYLEAMKSTHYQILTGYNGANATYEDVTYNQLTGLNTVATGKQYIVKDKNNKILVSQKIANAFESAKGDYNKFLENVGGYTQINKKSSEITSDDIHDAWDKYLQAVGQSINDEDESIHELNFAYKKETVNNDGSQEIVDYAVYSAVLSTDGNYDNPVKYTGIISYDGTTQEHRDLYDNAMALLVKKADTEDTLSYDAGYVSYYRNIYAQMTQFGYTTYSKMKDEKLISTREQNENKVFQDDNWLLTQLKRGVVTISYFSAVEKDFIKTTLEDDESIVEKEDTSAIALAEQEYKNEMDRIEKQDKRFDMTLNKLESEHTALQTEYESVSKVISKNVEKSFNIFNA
ncbi:hypothetical protein J6G99_08180 [bacterium]|nr:hypothetical protein [bacterium]